jgi:hypothetical protein
MVSCGQCCLPWLQVHAAIQQPGYERTKRGYKQIRGFPIKNDDNNVEAHNNNAKESQLPMDPLYSKQWYIVSQCFLVYPLALHWEQTPDMIFSIQQEFRPCALLTLSFISIYVCYKED